jgi:N-methylhydantoinase A
MTSTTDRRWAIGIDTGGTFTDLVAIEDGTQRTYVTKVPSTPHDPSIAVIEAVKRFMAAENVASERIARFAHGTTVATNAVLEGKGVPLGLLVTRGFRAIYELRAGTRPRGGALIDPYYQKPEPLVPQYLIEEVGERVYHDGTRALEPNPDEIRAAVRRLIAKGVKSIAVCYLFSFMDDEHEKLTAQIIRQEAPGLRVSLSSEILPTIREYPRIATTVLDAYVGPIMETYLDKLDRQLVESGVATPQKYVMQSHGGLMRIDVGKRFPNQTLLSGPAAGVIFGRQLGALIDAERIVTFDMGGTSTDIALLGRDGVYETNKGDIGGHDLATPMLRISTLGAGGGTIGWVGAGGLLKAGPHSAGSQPGPACYGRGGTQATVTDSDALMGYIDPEHLLGGRLHGDRDAAVRALEALGQPLGLDAIQTAIGFQKVITTNMAIGVRLALTEFGIDPRGVTLVALGGAGPVHACAVALFLGIPHVLVPPYPGNACASGLLQTDVRHVYVRSRLGGVRSVSAEDWKAVYADLEARAIADGLAEGFTREQIGLSYYLDVRYPRQGYELTVPATVDINDEWRGKIEDAFHAQHEAVYGIAARTETVEIVNFRVVSEMIIPKLPFSKIETGTATPPESARRGSRQVYFEALGAFVETPIYDRRSLLAGNVIQGGAIIEQEDCTTVVEHGATLTVDAHGNLIIDMPRVAASGASA